MEQHPGIQARSLLWPMLSGKASLDAHRETVYCEYYKAWIQDDAQATMLRNARYKLVSYHGLRTGELYDLEQNPQETHNRWRDPDYIAIKVDLLETLCERMAWTIDPLPQREADWQAQLES